MRRHAGSLQALAVRLVGRRTGLVRAEAGVRWLQCGVARRGSPGSADGSGLGASALAAAAARDAAVDPVVDYAQLSSLALPENARGVQVHAVGVEGEARERLCTTWRVGVAGGTWPAPLAVAVEVDVERAHGALLARGFTPVRDGMEDAGTLTLTSWAPEGDSVRTLVYAPPASQVEPGTCTAVEPVPLGKRWWQGVLEGVRGATGAAAEEGGGGEAADGEADGGAKEPRHGMLSDADLADVIDACAASGSEVWCVDRPLWVSQQRYQTAHLTVGRRARAERYQFMYRLNQERLQTAAHTEHYEDSEARAQMRKESKERRLKKIHKFILSVAEQEEATWTTERATFLVGATQMMADLRASALALDGRGAAPEHPWLCVVASPALLPHIEDVWHHGPLIDEIALAKTIMTESGARDPYFEPEVVQKRTERARRHATLLKWVGNIGVVALGAAVLATDGVIDTSATSQDVYDAILQWWQSIQSS